MEFLQDINIHKIVNKKMRQLDQQLKQLASYFSKAEYKNEKVSVREIAWHIDHSLKTIIGILEVLSKSDPQEYKPQANFLK